MLNNENRVGQNISPGKQKRLEHFNELNELAKSNSSNFLAFFKELYEEFYSNVLILCPEINVAELVFLAYLRLNFSTKEIAQYTFVTPKSVQMKKRRLRKKFNIPSDLDIYMWVNSIDTSSSEQD